ncbi:MAG TPA: adenylate/guanylate cyclase domain-containing protein [Mycobacteriales bacterium]|nr:adenylate/guanylate cyclase domain-containing protein [Mycobacteriales bacterium]
MAAVRRAEGRCFSCGGGISAEEALCPVCGEPTGPPERKIVTLLFADITGYTEMCSRLDPEQVFEVMRPAMTSLRRVAESFGATVPHIAGDGFMAVFGAPTAHEDDAERAVRAAEALQEQMRRANAASRMPLPPLRVGVETGEVLVAASRETVGFSVSGSTVNLAARLCDLAAPGRCLVGPAAAALTEKVISYSGVRRRRVKGLPDPVPARELVGVRTQPSASGQPRRPARFVGRVAELEALVVAEAAVRESARSAMFPIIGEPGQGKTRLAAEYAGSTDATVLRGRASSYGERLPLSALADAIAGHLGVTAPLGDVDPETVVLSRLESMGMPDAAQVSPGLVRLLGGRSRGRADGAVTDVSAARRLVEFLAERRFVLIILDDLHAADDELLGALADVAAGGWRGPVLVLGLSRPGADLGTRAGIRLGGLAEADMSAMLCELAGGQLPVDAQAHVLARAGGNPLFLAECAAMLAETGAIRRDVDGPVVVESARLHAIPSSMRTFIAARLDSLPVEEKAVVQAAAVLGERIWDRALPAESAGPLRALIERGLLQVAEPSMVPTATEYCFTHDLIREVAYESVSHRTRRERHAAAADWLLSVAASDDEFEPPSALLAHHYHQAFLFGATQGDPDCGLARAAVRHLSAWAAQLYSTRARPAEVAYSSALEVARAAPQCIDRAVRAELHVSHARACVEMSRYDEADADVGQALLLAPSDSNPKTFCAAQLVKAQTIRLRGSVDGAALLLDEITPVVERADSVRLRAVLALEVAIVRQYEDYTRLPWLLRDAYSACVRADDLRGQYDMAHSLAFVQSMEGGADYRRWLGVASSLTTEDDLRGKAQLRLTRAALALNRGEYADAAAGAVECEQMAIDGGFDVVAADALVYRITCAAESGDLAAGEALLSRLMEFCAHRGWLRIPALGLSAGASLAVRSGEPAKALERLAEANRLFDSVGARFERLEVDIAAVGVRADSGHWPEIGAMTQALVDALEPPGWGLYVLRSRVVAGRAALASGALDAAVLLAAALDGARRHDAPVWGALAAVSLEQAQLLAGQPASTRLESPTDSAQVRAVDAENGALRAWRTGDSAESAAWLRGAVSHWESLGLTAWLGRALVWMSIAERAAGDLDAAAAAADRAREVLVRLDAPSDLIATAEEAFVAVR